MCSIYMSACTCGVCVCVYVCVHLFVCECLCLFVCLCLCVCVQCGAIAQLVRESSNRVCTSETLQGCKFKSQ